MNPSPVAPMATGQAALLVAIGAVPGAWLRFRLINHLEPLLPRRHWGTFGVNLIACFSLGLLVGLEPGCGAGAQRLTLLLVTGFLGSFSTFSSFIGELWATLARRQWGEAVALGGGSCLGGLLALRLGVLLSQP
ncbi:MAG: fluoride efflux transporter FluC [Cyanobium sp.]|jgi:CrcB protein